MSTLANFPGNMLSFACPYCIFHINENGLFKKKLTLKHVFGNSGVVVEHRIPNREVLGPILHCGTKSETLTAQSTDLYSGSGGSIPIWLKNY